ncbi:hypothetical protein M758_12G177700 [Ceratodon purpureus]|uniref:Uncharacterized protein n=1 Tax=Ceratodon purpureus TaxID=3225 RepID=A0A8T0GBY3_CERPU|nr:hypothetical protein KC19_12G174100 [Ceratodon purpureus]KAG0599776.1 hypothetical protein M758_12G177700 [Ceratodon purpureus]
MASPNFCKSPPFPRPSGSLQATASLPPRDPADDLYEGYNDYDPQLHQIYTGSQSQIGLRESFESKMDSIGVYDHVPVYSRSSSASDIQGPAFSRTLTPHTTASMMWRPPSTSMSSRAQYNPYSSTDSSRPMTAIRAAGYSSRGSKFDPMNQASTNSSLGAQKKEEVNPEYQCREMERAVNQLLEASAVASLAVRPAYSRLLDS